MSEAIGVEDVEIELVRSRSSSLVELGKFAHSATSTAIV